MARAKARTRARLKPWRARFEALRPSSASLDPWVLGTACALLLGELEAYVWLGALAAELRLQLACLTLLASIGAALCRRPWRTSALAICALLWCSPFWPYLRETRPTPPHGPTLRVLQQDLAQARIDAAQLGRWLTANTPDVLSLTGIDARDLTALEKAAYGYKRLHPGRAQRGLLLVRSAFAPPAQARGHAALRVGRCTLEIVQVELPNVFVPATLGQRKHDIAQLGRDVPSTRRLYLGTFGSRGGAADLATWVRTQGLHDARLGHGILATAPGWLGALGVPLDQLFLHGWILVREASTGAPLADGAHRSLSATLELTEPRCASPRP